jgi:carbon monoxide dehydrogenase subunit G
MVKVSRHIRILAPVGEVWQVLADFPGIMKWVPGIEDSHALSAETRGIGAERAVRIPGLGTARERVTAWEEGSGYRYEWWIGRGPVPHGYSRWWLTRGSEASTVVGVEWEGELKFGALGRLLLSAVIRRNAGHLFARALADLKGYVEAGGR